MAMLGFIMIPLVKDDLTRHYETYDFIRQTNFAGIMLFLTQNVDFTFYLFIMLLSVLKLPKEFIPFTSVLIGYGFKFFIFFDFYRRHANSNLKRRNYFVVFLLITFMSTPFRNYALHIRNFIAVAFLLLGVYQLYLNDSRKGWILIAIAPTIHFMTMLIIPLILVSRYLSFHRLIRIAFILSFSFFLLPTNFITNQISRINIDNEGFESKQRVYTEGYYVTEYINDMSFKGRVSKMIGSLPPFFILFYLLLIRKKSPLRNLVYLSAILANFFFSTPMLHGRYSFVLVSLFFILILYEMNSNETFSRLKLVMLYLYLGLTTLTFFSRAYATRRQEIKSFPKMIYQSSLTIFTNKVEPRDYISN